MQLSRTKAPTNPLNNFLSILNWYSLRLGWLKHSFRSHTITAREPETAQPLATVYFYQERWEHVSGETRVYTDTNQPPSFQE